VFRLLLRRHPGDDSPLLPIKRPQRALRTACKVVGIVPALTPHKFRHIFSTRMAEKNVPYAIAAKIRRDSDGGKTFMKVYVHPRPDSVQMAVDLLERKKADAVETRSVG
jgi:integrase